MKMKDYGGPAFPIESSLAMLHPGMTLRDYFAAKAMVRIVSYDKDGVMSPETLARAAYSLADAMLKAREEGGAK